MTLKNALYISLSLLLAPTYLFSGDGNNASPKPETSSSTSTALIPASTSAKKSSTNKASAKSGFAKVKPAAPTSSTSSLPAASAKAGGVVTEEVVATKTPVKPSTIISTGSSWNWSDKLRIPGLTTGSFLANVTKELEDGSFAQSLQGEDRNKNLHRADSALKEAVESSNKPGLYKLVKAAQGTQLNAVVYDTSIQFADAQQTADKEAATKEISAAVAALKATVKKHAGIVKENKQVCTLADKEASKYFKTRTVKSGYESDAEEYNDNEKLAERLQPGCDKETIKALVTLTMQEPNEHKDDNTEKGDLEV